MIVRILRESCAISNSRHGSEGRFYLPALGKVYSKVAVPELIRRLLPAISANESATIYEEQHWNLPAWDRLQVWIVDVKLDVDPPGIRDGIRCDANAGHIPDAYRYCHSGRCAEGSPQFPHAASRVVSRRRPWL